MTSLRSFVVASLTLVVLTSTPSLASSQQVTAKDGDLLVYYCQNLAILTVRVFPKRVEVTTANRRAMLTETAQPSPARFSDGFATLSDLGELVRFEERGAVVLVPHRAGRGTVAGREASRHRLPRGRRSRMDARNRQRRCHGICGRAGRRARRDEVPCGRARRQRQPHDHDHHERFACACRGRRAAYLSSRGQHDDPVGDRHARRALVLGLRPDARLGIARFQITLTLLF